MPRAEARPTILFFHGNGEDIGANRHRMALFRELSANVMMVEYPGYGLATGRPSEAGCYAAADAAFDHLVGVKKVDPRRIVVVGWSLGGAVAIDLASRRRIGGLAAFSAFTSMTTMAQRDFPWLPVRLLLRHRFDSLSKIPNVVGPILLGHGTADTHVPFEMRDRLAAAARKPTEKLDIVGAAHNDFFDRGGEQIQKALARLVDRVDRLSTNIGA